MIFHKDIPEVFSGTVEVDETYIGGQWKNKRHSAKAGGSKRGRGTCKTPVFGILCRAVKLRRSLLAKVDRIKNGLEPPPGEIRNPLKLSELWDQFYSDYQIKVKSGSIEQSSLNRYINSINALYGYDSALERKLTSHINWKDFEGLKMHRQSKGFSPHGINTILRNMRTIFRYGVKRGLINHNPLDNVENIKTIQNDVRYLNEKELSDLKDVLNKINLNNPYQKDAHDLTLFYLYTGARTSEALYPNFSWNCIQHDKIIFPNTKSSKERIIPLTKNVDEVLKTRKHIIGGPFFTETGIKVNSLEDLIKNRITRDMVYNRTKFVFEKAGIRDVSTHNLRKTAGAYYYIATRDIFAASRFLGHSSVKVTESHYVGLIQSLQKEYSARFDDLLSKI